MMLKLLTYNIWFKKYHLNKRLSYISKIINELDPDIIALQEVTKDMLQILVTTNWFGRYYSSHIYDNNFNSSEYYGCILLSKYNFNSLEIKQFDNTFMNRKLIIGNIIIESTDNDVNSLLNLNIMTSHLESYNHLEEIRKLQLEEIDNKTKQYDNVIFLGDTNFCSDKETFPSDYIDLWDISKYGRGYTYDSTINKMINNKYKARVDRIYLKTKLNYDRHIKLVGTDPISDKLFPSDHFGIACELIV